MGIRYREEIIELESDEKKKETKFKEKIKMKANGVEKIIKVGMAFAGKKVEIKSRIDS